MEKKINYLRHLVNKKQLSDLKNYITLLNRWNKVYNLTAVHNNDILSLHILDSLAVAKFIKGKSCLDVGSGAGFPGLPLAITQPKRQFTLLDSNGKKTRFIQQVIITLKLSNVKVIKARVEKWQPPQLFDAIISRAFSSIQDFVNLTANHLQNDGILYAMKGRYPHQELQQLSNKFKVTDIHKLNVPYLKSERHLIQLRT